MLMQMQTPHPRTTRTKSRSPRTIYLTLSIILGSGGRPGRQTEPRALRRPVRIPHSCRLLLLMSETTLSHRLSTTPIRLEDAYTCLQQTQIDTNPLPLCTVFSLSLLLIHSTPDYACVSMTVTKPVFLYLRRPFRKPSPWRGRASRTLVESPRLEADRDWLAKPLSFPTHCIPSTYSGSIGRVFKLYMIWLSSSNMCALSEVLAPLDHIKPMRLLFA